MGCATHSFNCSGDLNHLQFCAFASSSPPPPSWSSLIYMEACSRTKNLQKHLAKLIVMSAVLISNTFSPLQIHYGSKNPL